MLRLNRLILQFFLLASCAAYGQAPAKVAQIGIVMYGLTSEEARDPLRSRIRPEVGALLETLRERGWVEGQNLRLHWRTMASRVQRAPEIIDELARLPVDLLLVSGNTGAIEAKKRVPTLPVVIVLAYHPDEYGIVQTLARPGGMVTGALLEPGRGINAKRIAMLKEAVPRLRRLAYIDTNLTADVHAEVQQAAKAQGVVAFPVSYGGEEAPDFASVFAEAKRLNADGMLVGSAAIYQFPEVQAQIHALAIRHRLPVMHCLYSMGETGGLFAYATDQRENWRIAARLVDRILRGAKPSDLPMEQTERFELIVNVKAAKAIGLKLPASILSHADRVID